jgi:hypothetical protein
LLFLGQALRQDPLLQKWTQARPEELVAELIEFQPLQRADGQLYMFDGRMPALALHAVSAEPQRKGKRWGRVTTYWLWYVFNPFQSDEYNIHGLTKGDRLKSIIQWRLMYWLYKQKLPDTVPTDEAVTDLQALSLIRKLEVGTTEYFNEGEIEGLKMTLTIDHLFAPYEETDPATFDLLDFSIHTFSAGTPLVPELEVEADIDQT